MKKAEKFATCGQAGSGCYMFNTHSGNVIIAGIPKEVSKVSKLKTTPERFDGLFALTHLLGQFDYYWFVVMLANFLLTCAQNRVCVSNSSHFFLFTGCMTTKNGTKVEA
jgi:hypothetical protein